MFSLVRDEAFPFVEKRNLVQRARLYLLLGPGIATFLCTLDPSSATVTDNHGSGPAIGQHDLDRHDFLSSRPPPPPAPPHERQRRRHRLIGRRPLQPHRPVVGLDLCLTARL